LTVVSQSGRPAGAGGAARDITRRGRAAPATGYQQHSYSLGSFAGQTVTLKFTGREDISLQTSFVVDDTAVNTG
jgi:hypothetical protein